MSPSSHIVDFSTNSKQKKNTRLRDYRPLPILIKNIQSICVDELTLCIIHMLDTADDRLFDMSESGFNNTQFDAMRLLRVKREGLVKSFKQELINNFKRTLGKADELDSFDGRLEDNVETLSFENIALVKDDDLEEDIATDSMVNKAKTKNQNTLENIRIRIDTLVPHKSIDQANNPFEPAHICDAFRTATQQLLDLDIASLLVIFKLFDRSVIDQLDGLYDKVNQFFVEKGVLPELKSIPSQSQSKDSTDSHDLQDLVDALPINETPSTPASEQAGSDMGVLNVIQQLMSARRVSGEASFTNQPQMAPNGGNVAPIDTQQLLSALSNIQIQQPVALNRKQVAPVNLRESIGAYLPSLVPVGGEVAFGQFNEDMIDIISMLFDFILGDKNLNDSIKNIIARLQIPMLKVGLVDKTFFSNRRHAARQLLNELAHAGLAWNELDNTSEAMFEKISSTTEQVIQEFDNDVGLFNELLEDFVSFKKQNQQRSDIFERRVREAEEGKALSESARGAVNQELHAICNGRHVPTVVKAILKNLWSHVMLLERLKDNEDGWKKRIKVAKLLVWSAQPVTKAERLEKLISKIPLLVRSLRRGIELISFSPIESTFLLDELESCHRGIIDQAKDLINQESKDEIIRLPAIDPGNNPIDPQKDFSGNATTSELVVEQITLEEIGFTSIETGESLKPKLEPLLINSKTEQRVEQLRAGSWLELKIDDEFQRCKLAARIATTGKYIFVNRQGMKMAEFYTEQLCHDLQLGNIRILDDEALFDRALESVISNLRTMKAQA